MVVARRDTPVEHVVDTGVARLVDDRSGGVTLEVDGRPQSHVDLSDPRLIAFDYVRRLADVADLVRPVDVVHLGFGAGTLARYVAATLPRSRQRAFEIDGALLELVRRELPLPKGVRVGALDALEGLRSLRDASADLVVSDVFASGRTPEHLLGRELASEVQRVLRIGGSYAVNVGHDAKHQVLVLAEVFADLVVVGEPAVVRGRRDGNLVVATGITDPAALQRAAGSVTSVLSGQTLTDWSSGTSAR
jgi:spermidine synthase